MAKYNKIYVVAPYNHATGGVELSHQLVDYLRNKNENAYIVYVDKYFSIVKGDSNVTPAYVQYNIEIASDVEDAETNILVLPEIYFELIFSYSKIKLGCWWMSVDGRYKHIVFHELIKHRESFYGKMRVCFSHFLLGWYRERNSTKLLMDNDYRIIHFYQSYYAYKHISNLGFTHKLPLSDYININFINDIETPKEDIILYNPSKGYAFTKKIIKRMRNYEFVPLKGLTRGQLADLMGRAKLYIDFGEFPGKDRLPREAVMNGCCIITGRKGASAYYEDVPLSDDYKFIARNENLPQIVNRIKQVLNNYSNCKSDFDSYRSKVSEEQDVFYNEIDNAFINN